MKLYHGTNGDWLQNILAKGLEPRKNRPGRNNWKHVPHQSNPRCVYLTNSYAPYFAFNAAKQSCAVIEVETDLLRPGSLYADEDCLEQMMRGRDGVEGTMSQRTLYYRKRQFDITGAEDKEGRVSPAYGFSLELLGTCAHRGTILPEAITRAVVWPTKNNAWMQFVWDPTITLLNQKILGNRYKALTAKLFGDPSPVELDDWEQQVVDKFKPEKIEGLRRIDVHYRVLINQNLPNRLVSAL